MNNTMIPQLPGTFFVALRQDFVLLCQQCEYRKDKSRSSPYCKALILSILDHWTYDNLSKAKGTSIHITIPQWEDMMYGMFKRNVIMDSLEELSKEEYIERQAFKAGNGGRNQYRYTLNYKRINSILQPTLKDQPCEVEEGGKFNDQNGNINVDNGSFNHPTVKDQRSSSVATLKDQSLIEEQKQPIETYTEEKESTPSLNPSLSNILQWVDELEIPSARARKQEYAQKLVPHIQSKEKLASLYTYAKGKFDKVYLGNLASDYILNGWLKTQVEDVSYNPGGIDDDYNDHNPLSEDAHAALVEEIRQSYPRVIFEPYNRFSVNIRFGDKAHYRIPVESLEDWRENVLVKDRRLLEQAVKYGER